MRILLLLAAIMLNGLGLVGANQISVATTNGAPPALAVSASRPVPALPQSRLGATHFSSAYTALTKCGSGMTKKEEKEAEEHGSDIPTRCKGYGGYDVYIYYSACTSQFTLDRGDESLPLATQAVDWKQKTVEWRMAHVNGKAKPFAVIMRVYGYAGDDQCASGGKITGESLIVKGLKGYEQIDAEIKLKGTPNPNAKARQIADDGYGRGRSSIK